MAEIYTCQDDILRSTLALFFEQADSDVKPEDVAAPLLDLYNKNIDAYNLGPENPDSEPSDDFKVRFPYQKKADARLKHKSSLSGWQIANCMIHFQNVIRVCWLEEGDTVNSTLALYQNDGVNRGIYDISSSAINELIYRYNPSIAWAELSNCLNFLNSSAPAKMRNQDPDLIAVDNGVFDYKTKTLFDFDPDYVFTVKSHVAYVEGAENPVITMPDGEEWDVESWVDDLTGDEQVRELLWQAIGASIRPNVAWNKAHLWYNVVGNNGKGTLCQLIRNLCGKGSYTSISIKEFGKDFMLRPLMYVSAVITDENDTGTFLTSGEAFKSAITHDVLHVNIKMKEPVDIRFNGLIIECVNEMPKFQDKSQSMYRRLLPIPFDKRFEGRERKYIKTDYIYRKEVLEYVLWKVLNTNYYEFTIPDVSEQLLGQIKESNDPIRQFLDETLDRLTWTFIPTSYLYLFYKGWFEKNVPSGKIVSRDSFIKDARQLIDDEYTDWQSTDNQVYPGDRLDAPELLLYEYGVKELQDPSYHGNDVNRLCTLSVDKKQKFRGFTKKVS